MNKVALKNISTVINSGLTPLRSNPEYWLDGNIPWVKTAQLGEKYIYDSDEKITRYALENTSIKLNPVNTLSIAMYGEGKTRGSIAILKTETTTNQACCNIVIDKNKADFEFVYYYLKTQYDNLRNLSSGVRKNLNSNDIKNFEINLPCHSTQKQLAKVLSDLDAKIEVNNKINVELETIAKALYDYWFVQFDFPGSDGKPYKSSGGKMIYNEELKLEIPEEWSSETLSDWIKNDGNGDWGKQFEDENFNLEVNCIRGADLQSLDGFKDNNAPIRFIHKNKERKILQSHDLIVEISGGSPTQSTGRICLVTKETFKRYSAPLICANFCKSVTLKNQKKLYNFYYIWKRAFDHGVMFNFEGKTSGIRNLLFSSLVESYNIVSPQQAIIDKFYDFMVPIQAQKQQNLLENQKLAELRDWLLPMLMNGQVTVGKPYQQEEEKLGMAAEHGAAYQNDKEAIDALFETINHDYETAVIQLLTERRFGFTYGKKYTHKMFSNIEMLNTMPKIKELAFEEKGWGMFSKAIAKTIDAQKFIYFHRLDNGAVVLKAKRSSIKEITNWMAQTDNKDFVSQVNQMLDLYEKPLINRDMDRIELLNTVLECMKVLETDNLQAIRDKMAMWKMEEEYNKTKAEKFSDNETLNMIGFIKEVIT